MKKNHTQVLAMMSVAVLTIAGCASKPIENARISSHKIEYKFIAPENLKSPITDQDIINEINNQITTSSNYQALHKEFTGSDIYDVKGISSIATQSDITLSYANGEYFNNTNSLYQSVKKVKYSMQISDINNGKKITIDTPSTISSTEGKNVLFLPISFLLSDSELSSDLSTIGMKMSPSLSYSEQITGEINVKYKDESVYANFKRILGEYSGSSDELKKYDITKEKIFNLKSNNIPVPLKITVYPYRDGSKVVYEFNYKYTINPNGTNTYNKNDIEKLVTEVKRVAEDWI